MDTIAEEGDISVVYREHKPSLDRPIGEAVMKDGNAEIATCHGNVSESSAFNTIEHN